MYNTYCVLSYFFTKFNENNKNLIENLERHDVYFSIF